MIIDYNNSPVQEDGNRTFTEISYREDNGYAVISGLNADSEEVSVGLSTVELVELGKQLST